MKKLTEMEINEIRETLKEVMKADNISQAQLARETKLNAGKLSGFISATYTGNNSGIAITVKNWLSKKTRQKEQRPSLPKKPNFYETPNAKNILDALFYTQNCADISLIYGEAGVSKTESCKHFEATNPNVWIITMRPSTSTLMSGLTQIAEEMGLSYENNSYKISIEIEKQLKHSKGLLIIEEAQHASIELLDEVRSWHDSVGIGIAIVGNTEIYDRLTSTGKKDKRLDRIRSRIAMTLRVNKPTIDDCNIMLDAWNIKDQKIRNKISKLAIEKGGHLRIATKVLTTAFISRKTETLTMKDINFAIKSVRGLG